MRIETAIAQLNKEREFLGLGMLELLQDIQREGAMIYSDRTITAYRVFMQDAQKLFAPVAE
jgi:hypothetical protein